MVDAVTLPCAPTEVFYNKTLAANYGYDPMKFIDYLSRYRIPLKDGAQKKMVLLVNSEDSARVRIARNLAEDLTELGLPTGTLESKGSNFKNILVAGTYDIYLGMTRLSPNMDLTEFFRPYGEMSRGGLQHETIYSMCLNALENNGNYYNLYQKLVQDGRVIPVMNHSSDTVFRQIVMQCITLSILNENRKQMIHIFIMRQTLWQSYQWI